MSLTEDKQPDNFRTESPIRAFTSFNVEGDYAVGKGFRPSLQHLPRYLNEMLKKEGWKLVQIIEATDPTMIFERSRVSGTKSIGKTTAAESLRDHEDYGDCDPTMGGGRSYHEFDRDEVADVIAYTDRVMSDPRYKADITTVQEQIDEHMRIILDDNHPVMPEVRRKGTITITPGDWQDNSDPYKNLADAILAGKIIMDDPVNPKHCSGRACADIGELLTANSYQILKYNWRLGEKDSPCVELGKALWYLDSEIALHIVDMPGHRSSRYGAVPPLRLPGWAWFRTRLQDKDEHVNWITYCLFNWNTTGDVAYLHTLKVALQTKLDSYNGCTEWGRGLEP